MEDWHHFSGLGVPEAEHTGASRTPGDPLHPRAERMESGDGSSYDCEQPNVADHSRHGAIDFGMAGRKNRRRRSRTEQYNNFTGDDFSSHSVSHLAGKKNFVDMHHLFDGSVVSIDVEEFRSVKFWDLYG